MTKKIHIFLLVFAWFILNIFLFIFSDNYRYFLQSLRHSDTIQWNTDDRYKISIENDYSRQNINDDIWDDIFSWLAGGNILKRNEEEKKDRDEKVILNKKEEEEVKTPWIQEEKKVEFSNQREEIKLSNIEIEVLNRFKKYDLKEIELQPRLFGLTWEYPHKYFEYYNRDINLYFFWNKIYSDIKDIFEVLTYELPFSTNEVNNFWDKSFYINLNPWFEDWYVRVVLEKSNRIFWFKIKRNLYEDIKNDLGATF